MEKAIRELRRMSMRSAIELSEYMSCIARNDERKSVSRGNFWERVGKGVIGDTCEDNLKYSCRKSGE